MNLFSNFKIIIQLRLIHFALMIFPMGCNGQVEPASSLMVRDVPDGFGKGTVLGSIDLICDSLQLAHLENGFDSLQIRFWFRYVGQLNQQLISISYAKKEWKATYCEFTPILDDKDSLVSFQKKIMGIKPRHSFNMIIDSLDHLGIWSIEDRSKIVNYPDVHNTDQVTIEISSMKMYRLFQHSDLEEVSKKLTNVAMVRRMVQLLLSEFNIKLIRSM